MPKREPFGVRWSIYIIFFALLAATFYFSAEYGFAMQSNNAAAQQAALMYSSIFTSFTFPAGAISYMMFRGRKIRNLPKELGLSRDKLTGAAISYGIILAGIIVMLELGLAAYSQLTNTPIPSTNTQIILGGMPITFLLFSAFIAPINEEIFFRAFLVPRIGIILSAIIFMLFHLGYGSVTELGGVVLYGLAAGYLYKRKGSLYSTILGHMLVNVLAVASFVM